MPALLGLAYTTAGGVIGAAVTAYLSRSHERRRLRADVHQQLHRVAAARDGVRDIAVADERSISYLGGRRLRATGEFGVAALLEDGTDAERALREAFEGLTVAALSAGVPRRALDFAGGGEERALQCEVIVRVDRRLGGVLDEADRDALMAACDDYREAATQLLLQALWHPWAGRLRMRARVRRLRVQVEALHRRQEAAMAVLAGPAGQHLRSALPQRRE
ncbi:hypothetical protein J4573_18840 [Actinomadura barringtoniae]|uniref:Uncharacterized protein n=1 Tax=Actinomadura barringtoniae TaxID=1427535 RepID=A0A939T489_9ACTN|nr:hypothetical protein [Actinomadura barringtoniae]MBO2449168.1 hypothetical protein [Actinomadura barringtoniae]